jgi:hypothetical protein
MAVSVRVQETLALFNVIAGKMNADTLSQSDELNQLMCPLNNQMIIDTRKRLRKYALLQGFSMGDFRQLI